MRNSPRPSSRSMLSAVVGSCVHSIEVEAATFVRDLEDQLSIVDRDAHADHFLGIVRVAAEHRVGQCLTQRDRHVERAEVCRKVELANLATHQLHDPPDQPNVGRDLQLQRKPRGLEPAAAAR